MYVVVLECMSCQLLNFWRKVMLKYHSLLAREPNPFQCKGACWLAGRFLWRAPSSFRWSLHRADFQSCCLSCDTKAFVRSLAGLGEGAGVAAGLVAIANHLLAVAVLSFLSLPILSGCVCETRWVSNFTCDTVALAGWPCNYRATHTAYTTTRQAASRCS